MGVPVVVENDANVAALAECVAGKGKTLGIDSLCILTLGTGVGGGIIFHGKIWDGLNGMAGEVGHINIWPDGAACGCGAHGCLEPLASATGVRRRAKELIAAGKSPALAALEKSNPDFTPRDVAGLASTGDRDAQIIFDEVGLALGRGLAALINTLNLPLYVVGGGFVEFLEFVFFGALRGIALSQLCISHDGSGQIRRCAWDQGENLRYAHGIRP